MRGPHGFTAEVVGDMESILPLPDDGRPPVLHIRHVKVTVISRNGRVYDEELFQVPENIPAEPQSYAE